MKVAVVLSQYFFVKIKIFFLSSILPHQNTKVPCMSFDELTNTLLEFYRFRPTHQPWSSSIYSVLDDEEIDSADYKRKVDMATYLLGRRSLVFDNWLFYWGAAALKQSTNKCLGEVREELMDKIRIVMSEYKGVSQKRIDWIMTKIRQIPPELLNDFLST